MLNIDFGTINSIVRWFFLRFVRIRNTETNETLAIEFWVCHPMKFYYLEPKRFGFPVIRVNFRKPE